MERKNNRMLKRAKTLAILTLAILAIGYVGYTDTEDERILTASVGAR